MRILVVSNYYPPVAFGGYEMQCASVVEHLRANHEVLVLTSAVDRGRAPHDPYVRRELPFLAGRRANLRAPFAALAAAPLAREILEWFKPELAYIWNVSHLPQVVLAVLAQAGVPAVYSVYDHSFSGVYRDDQFLRYLVEDRSGMQKAWGWMIRAVNRLPGLRVEVAAQRPIGIIWHSHALRRLNTAPRMLAPIAERVIYSTSRQAAAFASIGRHPAATTTIVFVGRVAPEKGPTVAYRALAALRERHGIEARLVLAGPVENSIRTELDGLARALRIEGQLDLRGGLQSEELKELFKGAHAIVIPSLWEEPYGLICLEAALARLPVVAARSGAMPEILTEGEHALFFPIGDVDACADALAAVLEHPEEARARVERAFAHAGSFSYERYVRDCERFVEEARPAILAASGLA